MIEALHYDFMQNALIAGLLISLACGVIGSLVVVNRMVFISGGIAHSAYGGIGLAFLLGIPPLLGAGLFSLFIALIIGILTITNKYRSDSIIGALWAAGMAFGIICIDLSPGYGVDLMSYLFGSILAVPHSDLWFAFTLDCVIILGTVILYKDLLALSYDEEYAALRGVKVRLLYFIILCISAITVVMTIRVVGLILVIALLTIPTYISEIFSRSLGRMMVYSSIISALFTCTGLWISYAFNITSGASIIMVATLAFFVVLGLNKLRGKRRNPSKSVESSSNNLNA
ncbi:MAG: metal ABC transporter permease [Candidatus Latescibacterota bacterium]